MKAKVGCLLALAILGALCVELWFLLTLSGVPRIRDDIGAFGLILGVIVISYLGVRIAMYHGKRIMPEFMTGGAGKRLVGLVGGVLLVFPGYLSDAVGLILLLPPVQVLLARVANLAVAAIARNAMKGMIGGKGFPGGGGGGFPGFPGGFPGGPFPGMKPDDRGTFPRPTKTIDTTVEKD